AILRADRIKLARGVGHDDNVALDRRTRIAEQRADFGYAGMRPLARAVLGRQRQELIVDGNGKNPVVDNRRRGMDRRPDILAPDDLAVTGIERHDLGIAGRDIKPAVPEARPAAERVALLVGWGEIDLPESFAAGRVERGDLHAPIHRENA